MPLANVSYTGTGIVGPYTVPFAYLDRSHVLVYLNGSLTSAYTWPTSSTIQFNSTVANGVAILVKRVTPSSARLTNYVDATVLLASDLNNSDLQNFYLAQEAVDNFSANSLVKNTAGTAWDATSLRMTNLADPTSAQDGVTRAYGDANYGGAAASSASASASAASASASAASSSASAAAASAASIAPATIGANRIVTTNPAGNAFEGDAIPNGMVRGNGSALSVATAGTDFVAPGTATVFTAQQTPMNGTLTDGATINWNGNTNGQIVAVTLAGNRTMAAPTNIIQYNRYAIRVTQDGTGSRTLSWNAAYKFGTAGAPTLTTTASKVDWLMFVGGSANTLEYLGARMDAV